MIKKKNVLIICPSLTGGGEEYRAKQLAFFLAKKKIIIRILTLKGFFLIENNSFIKTSSLDNIFFFFKSTIFGFKRLSLIPLFLFRIFNNKTFFSVANVYRNKKWLDIIIRLNNVISISNYVYKSNLVIELGNNKFKNFKTKWVYQNKPVEVLWIGKDNFHKGFERLIKLIKLFPEIKFNICGLFSSKSKKLLMSLYNVKYHGWVENYSFLEKKNVIYIQTSNQEGFPNVLVENMQLGIPIIASNVGATKDIVRDFGKVYNCRDFSELCGYLKHMILNYHQARRKSIKGIDYAKKRFDENKMLYDYYKLL